MEAQEVDVGVLVRRILTLTACLIFLVIVAGCMSLSFGERTEVVHHDDLMHHDDVPYEQCGDVSVLGKQELDVYYPMPFLSPPNLTMHCFVPNYILVSQQPDHFRVKNVSDSTIDVKWTAKGIKAPVPIPVVPMPSPTPGLPPEPLPAPVSPPR